MYVVLFYCSTRKPLQLTITSLKFCSVTFRSVINSKGSRLKTLLFTQSFFYYSLDWTSPLLSLVDLAVVCVT